VRYRIKHVPITPDLIAASFQASSWLSPFLQPAEHTRYQTGKWQNWHPRLPQRRLDYVKPHVLPKERLPPYTPYLGKTQRTQVGNNSNRVRYKCCPSLFGRLHKREVIPHGCFKSCSFGAQGACESVFLCASFWNWAIFLSKLTCFLLCTSFVLFL
jgi:hypothetical protein